MLCVFEQQNVDELGLVHMKTRQVVAIDVKNLNHQAPNLFALLWYVVVVPIVVLVSRRFTRVSTFSSDDLFFSASSDERNIVFTIYHLF